MNRKRIFASGVIALALGEAVYAAQDEQALEDVVVSASRIEQKTKEAPASVSIVTAKNLAVKNVQRVDEALTDQAGVYIKGAGDHTPSDDSGTVVSMRGISGSGRTAVLLDGQALNSPFSGGVNWSSIFADTIEKIEIVRGPFSSLYGGNAMGGVINIISRVPTKREISVRGGYGSNHLASAAALYRNRIDRLGISLGYGHKESDGYAAEEVVKSATAGPGAIPVTGWKATATPDGAARYLVGDRGKRWWRRDNAELKLYYDLSERSKLSLGASWNRQETGFTALNTYLRDAAGNPVVVGNLSVNGGAAKFTLNESDFLLGENGADNTRFNFGYETRFDNEWKLKFDAGYQDTSYWYSSALAGAASFAGPGKLVDIPNDRYYSSLQVDVPASDRHLVTVGVSGSRDSVHKREYSLANWQVRDVRGAVRYSVDGHNTNYGVFAQDEFYLRDNLILYYGGRYDYWSTEGADNQIIKPVFSNVFPRRSASAVSPKIAIVYLPQENTTLRASIGTAFKGPSMSQLYSSFTGYQSNAALTPEKSRSLEIGVEHAFPDQTSARATWYANYLKDLIYTTSISPTLSMPKNAGKAEIHGVEIELKRPLSAVLSAFANFTYNKALITENAALPLTVGKRITGTPQRMLNLGMEARKGDWTGAFSGRYVSNVYSNDQNLDVLNGVYTGTDPYTVWNLKVLYQLKAGISASLAVENVFNRQYYQYYRAAGRTFFGEVKLDF